MANNRDFVLTQIKKVVMTPEKTVTTITEKLETVDMFGCEQCFETSHTETECHNTDFNIGRAA